MRITFLGSRLTDAVAEEGEALDQLGKTLNLYISSAQTLLHLCLFFFFVASAFKSGCRHRERGFPLMMFTQRCCESYHNVSVLRASIRRSHNKPSERCFFYFAVVVLRIKTGGSDRAFCCLLHRA